MDKFIYGAAIVCILISCRSDATQADAKAYEAQKQSLADQERAKPLAFLHVKKDDKKNWIGQTVVHGTVTNTATVCSYKAVRLKMLCYDKNKVMVEEHEDLIDNIIKPNSSKSFTLRYRLPRGTDSVAVSIMSAAVEK